MLDKIKKVIKKISRILDFIIPIYLLIKIIFMEITPLDEFIIILLLIEYLLFQIKRYK